MSDGSVEDDEYRSVTRNRSIPARIADQILERIEAGEYPVGSKLQGQMSRVLEEVDLLLLPTLPIVAPALDALDGSVHGGRWPIRSAMSRLTLPFDLTGHPALTLP